MLLKKYDVEKNWLYWLLLLLLLLEANFCQFKRGGETWNNGFFSQKNQNLSNLKLIFKKSNIEGFKQFCNSITLL